MKKKQEIVLNNNDIMQAIANYCIQEGYFEEDARVDVHIKVRSWPRKLLAVVTESVTR